MHPLSFRGFAERRTRPPDRVSPLERIASSAPSWVPGSRLWRAPERQSDQLFTAPAVSPPTMFLRKP